MSQMHTARDLGPAFLALAEAFRMDRSSAEVYQSIVDSATKLISGCDHASISTIDRGRFTTVAASDDVARKVDDLERECGEGPCLDAIEEASFQYDADLTVAPTWPALATRCLAETPVRSALAFRLVTGGRKAGALDIFSDRRGGLDERSIEEASLLAAFAVVALAGALERNRADNLALALDTNRQIGKAIGLLMAAHKISDEQAFNVLKRTSQDLNRKMHDIAVEFVAKEDSAAATEATAVTQANAGNGTSTANGSTAPNGSSATNGSTATNGSSAVKQ